MAIELNNRTKILAGVVVLAAVGAGAWFFFLDDFLNEPPPKAAATKSAPADASKQAEAAKPAADAPKQAAAGSPGAKPIPDNPDRLTAEVMENSGIRAQFLPFAREVVLQADTGSDPFGAAEIRAVAEAMDRVYEPVKMNEELAANLKSNLDVERMGRYLEMLRRPIALKMNSQDTRSAPPDAVKEFLEKSRKSPPSPERLKLIQSLDDATRTSEVALEMSTAIARSMVDTMLAELQSKGKKVPKEASQMVAAQFNTMRDQARGLIRSVLLVEYRNVTDDEIAEYLKLIDTDTGRWGNEVLANAVRPVLASRGGAFGAEAGKLAIARRSASAKAPAANESVAKSDEQKSPEKPAAAPAAPVEVPGYRRPANIREVYTRYNDVISATVMRDQAAVKELLDDGKNPNARQKDGLTPLMIAAANGDTGIAGMLLAKGADPNLRAGGRSALSIAKAKAGAGMVQLLERSGAKD